jgi:hypothetical protein
VSRVLELLYLGTSRGRYLPTLFSFLVVSSPTFGQGLQNCEQPEPEPPPTAAGRRESVQQFSMISIDGKRITGCIGARYYLWPVVLISSRQIDHRTHKPFKFK